MMTSNDCAFVEGTDLQFKLGSRIGSGGQGAVYRVADHPNYAIKLLDRLEDSHRIAFVSRLDLEDVAVVAPVATVRIGDRFGYLMELAEDMDTLSPALFLKWWLIDSSVDLTKEDTDFYKETGGLKRRLTIAANVASTLASLHAQSLVYVDLNPNNVMVSRDPREFATLLIDTDNLTYVSRADRALHFPGYTAPEVQRTGPTTLSDAHSLAVLTFQLLALSHPMDGLASADMSADEWFSAVDKAHLPYVADPEHKFNRLPPHRKRLAEMALSKRMQKLAIQTFSEGLHNSAVRPGVRVWRDALHGALDNAVTCSGGCGWTFFRTLTAPFICPSCKHETQDATLLLVSPAGISLDDAYRTLVLSKDTTNEILPRHLWAQYRDNNPVLSLKYDGGVFHVEEHGDVTITDKKTGKKLSRATSRKGGEGRELLVQSSNQPDRIIKFMDATKR